MTELIVRGPRASNFDSIPTEDHQQILMRPISFQELPTELIEYIILFYTNSVEGLLFLRCINRDWKAISESSILWLHCSLTFYCPAKYLLPMKNHSIWSNFEVEDLKNYIKEDITAFVDDYENIITPIGLFQILVNETALPPTCKVICDVQQQRKMLTSVFYWKKIQNDREMPVNTSVSDIEVGIERQNSSTILSNRFEIAKEVSFWFITIFRQYHTHWQTEIIKLERFYSWHDMFCNYFETYILPCTFLFANVLLAVSVYGFTTLQANVLKGDFTWKNHLSFSCVYALCLTYILLSTLYIFRDWLAPYRSDAKLEPKLVTTQVIAGYDSLVVTFLTVSAMMAMLHAKAMQLAQSLEVVPTISGQSGCKVKANCLSTDTGSGPSFSWTLTVTPIWVAVIVCSVLSCYEFCVYRLSKEQKKFILYNLSIVLLTSATVQLMASYFDRHYIASIGYAVMPLFPIILTLVVLGLVMIFYIIYYWLYQGLIFQVHLLKRVLLLFGGFIYTLAILSMILAMVLLVLESFLGYAILLPSLSPIGEFAMLALCTNLVMTIHVLLSSPKHRLMNHEQA